MPALTSQAPGSPPCFSFLFSHPAWVLQPSCLAWGRPKEKGFKHPRAVSQSTLPVWAGRSNCPSTEVVQADQLYPLGFRKVPPNL